MDVEDILKAYKAIKPLAKRLGVNPPIPRVGGFCYTHLASLGTVSPLIKNPEEIDDLKEPEDYLKAEIIQKRIKICEELRKRYPESPKFIGHLLEGPITTAVMIMGQSFLTLPYDDPEQAHKLLAFCIKSALNYANSISKYFMTPIEHGPNGFPDDFAGMFPPNIFQKFVVPYLEKIFQGLKITERDLHSELLRVEHLPFLEELRVKYFDPGADQYLTPELLHKHCPCKFQSRILCWQIYNLSVKELEKMYRKISTFKPYIISFSMSRLKDEPKIKHLLEIAIEMKGEKGGYHATNK